MAKLHKFDPKDVVLVLGANPTPVSGYVKGTFIEADRNADTFKLIVGADGEGTRVRNRDRSGFIKVSLDQGSQSNDYFSALHALDEASGTGIVPCMLRHAITGGTLIAGLEAWVRKPAKVSYGGDNSEGRDWVIEIANADWNVAGS